MASSVEEFVRRAEKAEKEIEHLLAELSNLEKCSNGEDSEVAEVPEELEKLQLENKKLKYRLAILQRAAGEMATDRKRPKVSDDKTTMPSIAALLIDTFRAAVVRVFPDLGSNVPCPVTTSTQADYQFNGAMAIAGILKVRKTHLIGSGCSTVVERSPCN